MRRTIKALSMAAVASLALSAFVASAAQAGHTWRVAGINVGAGVSKTCETTADGTITLHVNIPPTLHLTSNSVSSEGCTITQEGSGATAVARGTAKKITFNSLTVDVPPTCKADPSVTVPVRSQIITVAGVAYITFAPEEGATFTSVKIKECPEAETYAAKGSICAEMAQSGVQAVQQTLKFSAVADAACPGDKLTVGGAPAILRGGINFELTGPDAGKAWGWIAT